MVPNEQGNFVLNSNEYVVVSTMLLFVNNVCWAPGEEQFSACRMLLWKIDPPNPLVPLVLTGVRDNR